MTIKMAHAALTVSTMENCLKFYRDLLGLKVALDYGEQPATIKTGDPDGKMHVMMLADDEGNQCIEPFEFHNYDCRRYGDKAQHTDYFISHVAFTVDGLKELYNKLVDAGVDVSIPFTDAGGYKFAYVYDFDGSLVELIEASTY